MNVFKLSSEGLMARAWEKYNGVVVAYFIGTQQDHYVRKSRYVIAQVDGKEKVRRLEALMEILTFCQGNKFALGSLDFVMLITKINQLTKQHGFFRSCRMS